MPFIYHATGWSFQPNRADRETDTFNPVVNILYPADGVGTYKYQNGVSAKADLISLVDPKWQSTRNLWAPVATYGKNFTGANQCDFFGSLYPPDVTPPPVPQELSLGKWRIKPKSSYKEFLARRAAGEIIVNPLDSYAASATIYPGIHNLYTGGNTVWFQRSQYNGFPNQIRQYSPVWGRAWVHPSFPPNWCTKDSAVLVNISSRLRQYSVPTGGNPWYMPTDGEVWDLVYLVRDTIVSDPDPGLVTSALAEANNKNWDILTEVAEAPEAIRYILGVLQQILRLCNDFRNEVKRLRKSYYRAGGMKDKTQGSHEAALTTILSQKWLEFRYALMPLVHSVDTAMKWLATGEVEYQTTRKRLRLPVKVEHPDWDIAEFEVSHRCYIKRRFEFDGDRFSSNSDYLTMNVLSTLWELTTLSFVIDWAFNVGDYLTSLQAPSGTLQTAGMYSTQIRDTVVCRHKRHVGAEIHLHIGRYKADPIHPPAHTGLAFNLDLNWKRALDALSLLWLGIKSANGR